LIDGARFPRLKRIDERLAPASHFSSRAHHRSASRALRAGLGDERREQADRFAAERGFCDKSAIDPRSRRALS